MSDEDCVTNFKKRFKGVETFLRRVAFNLGNSPSQTEVKIISCIPIDVTDLQQKIVSLEKRLQEAARNQQEQHRQPEQPQQKSQYTPEGKLNCTSKPTSKTMTVNTALYELSFNKTPMNNDEQAGDPCPKTESPKQKKSTVSFILDPPNAKNRWSDVSLRRRLIEDSIDASVQIKKFLKKSKRKLSRKKNKNTQLIYYAQTTASPFNISMKSTAEGTPKERVDGVTLSYLNDVLQKQYSPKIIDRPSNASDFSSPICRDVYKRPHLFESEVCSCCNGKFHNVDQDMTSISFNNDHSIPLYNDLFDTISNYNINECIKSDSIYYDTNFYDIVPVKEVSPKSKRVKVDSKNADKIHTKFKEKLGGNCWHENVRTKRRTPLIVNYYQDTIPTGIFQSVRKNEHIKLPRQENNIKMMSSKNDALTINTINQETGMNSSNSCYVECGDVYYKKHRVNHGRHHHYHNYRPRSRHHYYKEDVLHTKHRKTKLRTCKNTACSIVNINHSECQTAPPENNHTPVENKAQSTLNQIKTILETVLTEVKTTSQNPKQDAVVQKEISQNNMQGASSFMHSFTYSPYNINQSPYSLNPYAAACSQQIGSNLCCPGTFQPIRRMQNFPLFVQPMGRRVCSGCYRHSTHITKSGNTKNAVTASTNTDLKPEIKHSKETEKLIREIYKSIALDIPTKDTSNSECYDIKPSLHTNTDKSDKTAKTDEAVYRKILNVPKENIKCEALMTPFITYNFDSKSISAAISMHSQQVSTTDTDKDKEKNRNGIRNDIITTLMNKRDVQSTETEMAEDKSSVKSVNLEQRTRIVITSDDDSESTSDDTESNDTVVINDTVKKKKKKGIFSKMFQNVKLFKSKDKKRETELENEDTEMETSDSDDYQTIYSKKTTPKHVSNRTRHQTSKPHTKYRSHSRLKSYQRKPRRSPYMEQEYKRHWNEHLTFHEGANYRRSSEQPFSRHAIRSTTPPYYMRNYEARSALVDRKGQSLISPKDYSDVCETRVCPVDKPTHVAVDATRGRARHVCAPDTSAKNKGLSWLKKHKVDVCRCGEQWKKFILES